jgi:hypothetical protein
MFADQLGQLRRQIAEREPDKGGYPEADVNLLKRTPVNAPQPLREIPAPIRPAISAWLSLVGMPYLQADTAQMTMESCAAPSVTSASSPVPI